MPWFVCQNEDCGHRFFERSELAAMSPCPVCEEDRVEPEYDEPTPPATPTPTRERVLDARNDAERFLQKHAVTDAPIDVERLAHAEGFTIERRPLGGDDGETVGRCITVNSDQPLVRQRFTIAHELGHFVMHSSHGTDDESERQADVFAGALLIPRGLLRREFTTTKDPEVLSRRFLVSRDALWIALKDARLVTKIN
jgi:IrrE N-terminal-like domain